MHLGMSILYLDSCMSSLVYLSYNMYSVLQDAQGGVCDKLFIAHIPGNIMTLLKYSIIL